MRVNKKIITFYCTNYQQTKKKKVKKPRKKY